MLKPLAVRGAVAFGIPVLVVFALSAMRPEGYFFLAAGPLCGIIGGLSFGRRWGFAIVLGFCFGVVGLMFSLQDTRSALFSDVVWTGLVSAFLFWTAGGCAVLTLPAKLRFNAAAALAIPGGIAGMAFQFSYGPGHFLFDLGSFNWWNDYPWSHLILWLIAALGGGWLLGAGFTRVRSLQTDSAKFQTHNVWPLFSVGCGLFGLLVGLSYFFRSKLPLGLFNSLSPSGAISDWMWGWAWLAGAIAAVAAASRHRRRWTAAGLTLAVTLLIVSYRVDANPWKSTFNSKYAERLLREQGQSGDAIYTGNLILAQAAIDNNDIESGKRYLLNAANTPGARKIEQNGLDVSVARVLFDRGEKDAVLEYLHRGHELWPQGVPTITRWEAAIRAGRRPNFNNRDGGPQGQ